MGRLPEPLSRLQPFVPVDVTLSQGFWMGKFEVTQSQWQRVMGVTLREQRARDPSQPRPVGDETMRDHLMSNRHQGCGRASSRRPEVS